MRTAAVNAPSAAAARRPVRTAPAARRSVRTGRREAIGEDGARGETIGEDGARREAVGEHGGRGDTAGVTEDGAPAQRARRRRGRTPQLRAVPDADGPPGGSTSRGGAGGQPPRDPRPGSHAPRVRIRKLRVFAILLGLGVLAVVSTVFGMMMAVTSDLPRLEEPAVRNSVLVDRKGRRLGLLTGSERRIFVRAADIAPVMKQAIIAIEDRRFYTNDGIDYRGIGRALYQDVVQQRVVQGGSTITQQFVKNALAAQDDRTVFQKLREAALAFQITRKWSKERILRNYLNTIYFGNGAYGIESAAKTYFGSRHPGLRRARPAALRGPARPGGGGPPGGHRRLPQRLRPAAPPARGRRAPRSRARPHGAAGLHQRGAAGGGERAVAADAQRHPAARRGHGAALLHVVDQAAGGRPARRRAGGRAARVRGRADRPHHAGHGAPGGGELAVDRALPYTSGPRAALVALENRSGEVLAMVGGDDYRTQSFNLATQGQRQPGSAFKPFVLAQALKEGISTNSVWESRKRAYCIKPANERRLPGLLRGEQLRGRLRRPHHAARATTFSDNAVYANLGIQLGTRKIAMMARRLGIRTPVSRNLAMILGGLRQGVTPLDMAHAYETFARGGKLTYGTLSPGAPEQGARAGLPVPGPVGLKTIGRFDDGRLRPIELPDGDKAQNERRERRVLSPAVAGQVTSLLSGVVQSGTAVRAQIPGVFVAGKTGTTENYGDAWFVGWTREITVAVWVGYPDELRPMETEFAGEPVAGGTYPALICKDFVEQAMTSATSSRGARK